MQIEFKKTVLYRVFHFYREGFRSMTLGKTLWALILIKLFIMFAVLKLFFFPNQLSQFDTKSERADHVIEQFLQAKP